MPERNRAIVSGQRDDQHAIPRGRHVIPDGIGLGCGYSGTAMPAVFLQTVPWKLIIEGYPPILVNPGDGDDLVQQAMLLRSTGGAIPLTLHGRVLPKPGSRHGALLCRIGNR